MKQKMKKMKTIQKSEISEKELEKMWNTGEKIKVKKVIRWKHVKKGDKRWKKWKKGKKVNKNEKNVKKSKNNDEKNEKTTRVKNENKWKKVNNWKKKL